MPTIPHSPEKIDAEEADYLYINPSQIANAGLGLFTAIPIFKNEIISIFKGELLTNKEAKLRASQKQDAYFINTLSGKILDSKNTECFAKYANDANGKMVGIRLQIEFKNNSCITLSDNDEICIVALKNIKPHQEIFCSYGDAYWQQLHF